MATSVNTSIVRELSDLRPAGARLGRSAADLVGFWGATPVAQQTVAQSTASTALTSTVTLSVAKTGIFGYASSTVAAAYAVAVRKLRADMYNLMVALRAEGLIVSS